MLCSICHILSPNFRCDTSDIGKGFTYESDTNREVIGKPPTIMLRAEVCVSISASAEIIGFNFFFEADLFSASEGNDGFYSENKNEILGK